MGMLLVWLVRFVRAFHNIPFCKWSDSAKNKWPNLFGYAQIATIVHVLLPASNGRSPWGSKKNGKSSLWNGLSKVGEHNCWKKLKRVMELRSLYCWGGGTIKYIAVGFGVNGGWSMDGSRRGGCKIRSQSFSADEFLIGIYVIIRGKRRNGRWRHAGRQGQQWRRGWKGS